MKTNKRTLTNSAPTTNRVAYLAVLALLAASSSAQAGDLYWDGTAASWNTASGWSTSASATTPDPASAPGASDNAFFNIDSVTTPQTLTLDANQSAAKLILLDTTTGGATLLGGGTDRTLSLDSGGLEVRPSAGPLVIGSSTNGQRVSIALTANQSWTNSSANAVTINNTISAPAAQTLTLRGTGGYRLNGANTFTGNVTAVSTVISIGNDAALGSGQFLFNSGTLLIDDFPRTIANKVRANTTATMNFSGDGPLTLSGNGSTPSFTISSSAAPSINIINTAPMTIAGIYLLCDSSSPNNNPQSPTLASGANLNISADIWETSSGNSSNVANKGAKFVFTGTGANLTLTGTNQFGEGASLGRSTDIVAQPGTGFNTITIGGPGTIITPFGLSALFTNNGQGFYLKALENGLVLSNNIALGASTNNDGGKPIGFTGENDLTLAGSFTLGASVSFPNLASGTLTFSGILNCVTNRTLTILGPGNTVFSSSSTLTGIPNLWGGIAKSGPGTLTLAGSSDLLGATSLRGGNAILDYSASNTSRLTAGTNTVAALVLGGVDLQLKGGNFNQTLGAGGGTTLDFGFSRIRRTNSGTSSIALGAITRNSGGMIDFESGVASTTTLNTSGILGTGYATVGTTDWATVSGGSIVALTNYGTFAAPGTDQNVTHTGTVTLASASIRTLKLATSGPGESLSLSSGNLTLNGGGLLFVGTDDYTINNNSLVYTGGLCIHQNGSGALTMNTRLSGGFLQKSGPGRLILAVVTNNYTTSTYLHGGTLSVHADGCLGSGSLSFNGGTLQTTAGFTTAKAVSLNANGGTFQVDTDTLELTGIVSGNYGALTKTGSGTLLLSNTNLYNGPTTISAGTLKLGSASALGVSAAIGNRAISPVTIEANGTLDLAGKTNFIGNFTLAGGRITDSIGGGALGAYSFNVQSGSVDVALADVKVPYATNPSNRINLFKRSPGTVTLAGTNTYSGTTFVEAGTLRVTGSLASSVIVQSNGTFCGSGTIARTLNVEGGTLLPGADDSGTGTLTLSRHLRLSSNGTLKSSVSGSGSGCIVLTNQQARVLLENPVLNISLLPGGSSAFTSGITLIDNQGVNPIEGTFLGLPEGGSLDLGSQRVADITYLGGDGNDVTLTLQYRGSVITVR